MNNLRYKTLEIKCIEIFYETILLIFGSNNAIESLNIRFMDIAEAIRPIRLSSRKEFSAEFPLF